MDLPEHSLGSQFQETVTRISQTRRISRADQSYLMRFLLAKGDLNVNERQC